MLAWNGQPSQIPCTLCKKSFVPWCYNDNFIGFYRFVNSLGRIVKTAMGGFNKGTQCEWGREAIELFKENLSVCS